MGWFTHATNMRKQWDITAPLNEILCHWSREKKIPVLFDTGIVNLKGMRLFHNLHRLFDPLVAVKNLNQIHTSRKSGGFDSAHLLASGYILFHMHRFAK